MPQEATEDEIRVIEGLDDDEVRDERIRLLRAMYVRDEISVARFELHVEQALRGEQPTLKNGLPFMPDPALYPPESSRIASDTIRK